jgi:Rod binding domain-containing protein
MASYNVSGLSASAISEYAMQESKNASSIALQKKLENTTSKTSDNELWQACKGFEAYFMEQIYKEMQKSVDALKSEDQDKSTSTLVDYFKNQTLQDICADSVDTQSNGFAQMLYENLKRNYDIPTAPEAEKTQGPEQI